MLTSSRRQRIWLAQHRVDFRKQHNGLLAEAYKMGLDPFMGDMIIFVGRSKRMLKVLYADATGLFVSAKLFTMEAMKTKFRFISEPLARDVTEAELSLLLEGSRYTIEKKVTPYWKAIASKQNSDQSQPSPSLEAVVDERTHAGRIE
jgi:transposase